MGALCSFLHKPEEMSLKEKQIRSIATHMTKSFQSWSFLNPALWCRRHGPVLDVIGSYLNRKHLVSRQLVTAQNLCRRANGERIVICMRSNIVFSRSVGIDWT